MTDLTVPTVPDEIIQALLDGERVCPTCSLGNAHCDTEACPHRQAQLEAVLGEFYITVYVPWYACRYTGSIEWPTQCGRCGDELEECALCGFECDCLMYYDYAPFCRSCVIDDDAITIDGGIEIDDVLAAALTRIQIVQYRRRPPVPQPVLF